MLCAVTTGTDGEDGVRKENRNPTNDMGNVRTSSRDTSKSCCSLSDQASEQASEQANEQADKQDCTMKSGLAGSVNVKLIFDSSTVDVTFGWALRAGINTPSFFSPQQLISTEMLLLRHALL